MLRVIVLYQWFLSFAPGVEISFTSDDYDTGEEDGSVLIQLNVDRAQRDYTIILRPVSVNAAIREEMNDDPDQEIDLTAFTEELGITNLRLVEQATPGIHFQYKSSLIEIKWIGMAKHEK